MLVNDVAGFHKFVELANDYVTKGQYEEALKTLEDLVERGCEEGYIYLAIGEICKSCHDRYDPERAKMNFFKAIALGKSSDDHQVVVAAKAGLAGIANLWNREWEAEFFLEEARRDFDRLIPEQQWDELRARIDYNRAPIDFLVFMSLNGACCTSNLFVGRCMNRDCKSSGSQRCPSPIGC
jgi:tetratricopeptide (TPR) repeat protein